MNRLLDTTRRWILPLAFSLALVLALVTGWVLSPIVGIKAAYPAIGLGLAILIQRYGDGLVSTPAKLPDIDSVRVTKSLIVIGSLAIAVSPFGFRAGAVLISLAIGYGLLGLQLLDEIKPRILLFQVLCLFAIPPTTKYVSTGFYFGNGDLLVHVYRIREVLEVGSISVIGGGYSFFPGLHLLITTVSSISGMTPYDSLLLTGIITYAMLVMLMYIFSRNVVGDEHFALLAATATTLFAPVSFYATYFFPQALATALALFLFLFSVRALTYGSRRDFLLGGVIGVALIFTHHLTLVLFVPIVLITTITPLILKQFLPQESQSQFSRPHPLLLYGTGIIAVVYWLLNGVFINYLYTFVVNLLKRKLRRDSIGKLSNPTTQYRSTAANTAGQSATTDNNLAGQSGAKPHTEPTVTQDSQSTEVSSGSEEIEDAIGFGNWDDIFAFGKQVDVQTSMAAVQSLVSVGGLYNILLVTFGALGVVSTLRFDERIRRLFPYLLVGLVGFPLVLRTPLTVIVPDRVNLPFTFFCALVVAVALRQLRSQGQASQRGAAIFIALLLVTGPLTGLAAGDDLYGLNAGPNLFEFTTMPEQQVEFSEGEYAQLAETSDFVRGEPVAVQAPWITREALQHFGVTGIQRVEINSGGIQPGDGLFVYRQEWTDHRIGFQEGQSLKRFIISEEYLDKTIAHRNKIYDTGRVGITWNALTESE